MTKEELQAKHRLEEAQARNRQKERKARTRRLIQEGAILENVMVCKKRGCAPAGALRCTSPSWHLPAPFAFTLAAGPVVPT